MRELFFAQAVEVGHQTIQLGAQFGAFGGVDGAVLVALQADGLGEVVELGGGADKAGSATGNGCKCFVLLTQPWHRTLVDKKHGQVGGHLLAQVVVQHKAVHKRHQNQLLCRILRRKGHV